MHKLHRRTSILPLLMSSIGFGWLPREGAGRSDVRAAMGQEEEGQWMQQQEHQRQVRLESEKEKDALEGGVEAHLQRERERLASEVFAGLFGATDHARAQDKEKAMCVRVSTVVDDTRGGDAQVSLAVAAAGGGGGDEKEEEEEEEEAEERQEQEAVLVAEAKESHDVRVGQGGGGERGGGGGKDGDGAAGDDVELAGSSAAAAQSLKIRVEVV